jgi:hypothetical protein
MSIEKALIDDRKNLSANLLLGYRDLGVTFKKPVHDLPVSNLIFWTKLVKLSSVPQDNFATVPRFACGLFLPTDSKSSASIHRPAIPSYKL